MASIQDSFDRVLKPLSTPALRVLHEEIRRVLEEEDAMPTEAKRYGVRKFPDFKVQADVIERILRNREQSFEPIRW
jgi:hypothetical protein